MKRAAWLWVLAVALAGPTAAPAAGGAFDFAVLRERARLRAAKPYEPRTEVAPAVRQRLNYDQYRRIQFRAEQSWWRSDRLPFQLQFFYPGFLFTRTVTVAELAGGRVMPIRFSPGMFDLDGLKVGDVSAETGFGGFRVLYDLNHPGDELGAFLGASYFRMLCTGAAYGLSARGLALNTAEPGGEEFPVFEDFWVERPAAGATQLVVYALLDSASAAGAYQFTLSPGADTVTEVKAAVYCRQPVKVFGMAPLTSMFWFGENSPAAAHRDPRPEVHDSDGLMIESGAGEWSWRPLTNPAAVRVMSFIMENPRGFGLIQRDRAFASYEDREARYQLRPSAWVEPIGSWGRGSVRLVELPTGTEYDDNIVAFWAPDRLPAPGEPVEFQYKVHWYLDQIHPPGGWATATHVEEPGKGRDGSVRFTIDFDGPDLRREKAESPVEPVLTVGEDAVPAEVTAQQISIGGGWRVTFALKPDGSGRPVELRCFLKKAPHILTETWTYLWNP